MKKTCEHKLITDYAKSYNVITGNIENNILLFCYYCSEKIKIIRLNKL